MGIHFWGNSGLNYAVRLTEKVMSIIDPWIGKVEKMALGTYLFIQIIRPSKMKT